ncbi:MAG: cache domain-containing protein [Magnetococcales bacterium]|nr:cache domain-containing protein [Magnetococcales bacterium]
MTRFSRIISLLVGLIPVLISAPAFPEALSDPTSASRQANSQMDEMLFRISMFHHEARSSLLSSLDLPFFQDYFALPESRKLARDSNHMPLFSKMQQELRHHMESWAVRLHRRFPIAETCLVDHEGQEHLRVVGDKAEAAYLFSDHEQGAPFFEPAFRLPKGAVHLSKPYMSADSLMWVVAFVSPVVLPGGQIPGFLHFEVPLSYYQELVMTKDLPFRADREVRPNKDEEGRYFILDENGLLLADSGQVIELRLKEERNPRSHEDLPDYLPPEKLETYLPPLTSIQSDPVFLQAVAQGRGKLAGETVFSIGKARYILVYRMVPDRPWILFHLDPILSP